MTIFLGVDPAAQRLDAVVIMSDGSWVLHKRTMPKDIVERCVVAQRWIESIVKPLCAIDIVEAGVEEPVLSGFTRRSGNGSLPVAKVHGALLAGAARAGARVTPMNNKTWKRTIVGNGNAGKPQVNLWVRKHWPALWVEANGRQDTCDAACIALELREMDRRRKKTAGTRQRIAARTK